MTHATFSPRARRDLEEIWDYSVERWGDEQAERYLRQLQASIDAVAVNPLLGRACDEVRAGYRKFPSASHVLFYRIVRNGIEVVRILHARMDVERNIDL